MLTPLQINTIKKAEQHGIKVTCRKLVSHWICAVRGEVAHINDLPRLVEAEIAKQRHKEAA